MKKIKTKYGSALIFSLIILFIGVVAALGIASTTIISQKMSGETGKSTQAFQTADSGAEIMLQKIKNAGSADPISSLGIGSESGCVSRMITDHIGTGGSEYNVTFFDEGGNALECTDDVSEIARINSVGSNAGTARAVNVAVASGGTNIITGNSSSMTLPSGNYDVLCWATYFSCFDLATNLQLDGTTVKSYTGANNDSDGCDQNTIMIKLENVASGIHTWSISRGNQKEYMWMALQK
jgi:hypothetical protein